MRNETAIALLVCLAAGSGSAAAQHAEHERSAAAQPQPAGHEHAEPEAPAAQHSEHAGHSAAAAPTAAPFTEEQRAAAFPDLGDMRMSEMMLENPLNKLVLIDRFEWHDAPSDPLLWDVDAWIGRDLAKLWIRSEGERNDDATEHAEVEVLWGKSFARWWDVVAGARYDAQPGPERSWAAFGFRGTAPYRFDIEATTYVGEGGDMALRFEGQYDILVTNRLVLEPLLELDWYGQSDAERGTGAGLSEGELGLRLRYELRREVAPYVGLTHVRSFGRTADFTRAAGEDPDDTRWVAGIRVWF
jgi:copper resistance protein B